MYLFHNHYIYARMIFVTKILKKYLIHNQVFVALMGTLLSIFFLLNVNNVSPITIGLIFITYLNGYFRTKFQNNNQKIYKILFLNGLSFIIVVGFLWHNDRLYLLCKWLIIIFLGLFYNSRYFKLEIRKIPLLKIFFVGLMWALVNAWLAFEQMQWGIFFTTWFYITALIIPFDIRDKKKDDIVTFPKLIGIKKSKFFATILLLMSLLFSVFFLNEIYFLSFFISILVAIGFIFFANEDRKELYFSLGVESCVGIPFLFLILMK